MASPPLRAAPNLPPNLTGAGDEAGGSATGGASESIIPVLGYREIFSRLQERAKDHRFKNFQSMYSSVFGGITTNVACMVLPLDDHMVHRGHSVFDTAILLNGHLYELDAHLDRFLRSAAKAKITPPFDRATIREILVQTAAAGKCQSGILRYWMSVGRGNFDLSAKDCTEASLYACLVEENVLENGAPDGVKVITSSVPIKDKFFASVKSTNYLPNALVVKEAEEKGASVGIWLDEEGNIAEGQNMNLGFLTNEGELLLPTFDRILSGCTAQRVLQLVPELVKEHAIPGLKGVRLSKIPEAEARRAKEMMLIMSGWLILPVVEWDGKLVGTGKPGPVSQALLQFMQQDMLSGPSALRTPVPYQIQNNQLSLGA
ncbi:hypothetical protein M758_9G000800 [Ceratodon purpureus]|uniref:Uncharacterized protein n=1 Tax=Ceratodon purpureus TaxID=3225 RepID=A0A8T0GSH6_CERPU|nr:hypothetical protein KC19_9G000900 [Ceratodon purpureus]KAG0604694.1 hypothetical protein M758_9G000800 [Ceratodon purpureus]